jgi:hypothetical protein
MKITEAIAAEHATLLKWFDQVEAMLPRLTSRTDVSALAALVGGVLTNFDELETEYAIVPLDHARPGTSEPSKHAQEHHKISRQLAEVRQSATYPEACRRLRATLGTLRERLRAEEQSLFPVLEEALNPEDSNTLANAYNGSRLLPREAAESTVLEFSGGRAPLAAQPAEPLTRRIKSKPRLHNIHFNKRKYTNNSMALTPTKSSKKQTFRLTAPKAKRVMLVGDFTQWEKQPIPLQQQEPGIWAISVDLPPGKHPYRFVVDGQWCDDPECRERVPNPFGGHDNIREAA